MAKTHSIKGDLELLGIAYMGDDQSEGTTRTIELIGSETNIGLDLVLKGTGVVRVPEGYEDNISADRDLINRGYANAHLGGVSLGALVTAPGASQDGFALVYDHATTSYTLVEIATALTFENGLTEAGGTVKLGGTVSDAETNVTVDAAGVLRIRSAYATGLDEAGLEVEGVAEDNNQVRLYATGGSIRLTPTEAIVTAPGAGALKYNADYSDDYEDRTMPDVAWVSSHIGGLGVDANVMAAGASEDGYIIAWDNASSSYKLLPTTALDGSEDYWKVTGTSTVTTPTIVGSTLFTGNAADTITASTRMDVRGAGTTLASNALRVANSGNTTLFLIRDDGRIHIGANTQSLMPTSGLSTTPTLGGASFTLVGNTSTLTNGQSVFYLTSVNAPGITSGTVSYLRIGGVSASDGLVASSGTAGLTTLSLAPLYNTTGTYSGTAYGIDYNPTLSSTTGLTHVAARFTSGDVVIGHSVTTSGARLSVRGSGTTSSSSSITATNSSGTIVFWTGDDNVVRMQNIWATNSATMFSFRPGAGATGTFVGLEINPLSGYTAGSGHYQAVKILPTALMSSGNASMTTLLVAPTLNVSGTYSGGTATGIDYNPTLTSTTGLTHYAALFRSGQVGIGTAAPTTNWRLDVLSSTVSDGILRLANSSNVARMTVSARGPLSVMADDFSTSVALFNISGGFVASSGTGLTFLPVQINPTYNTTGTVASSVVRGIYYNPTLTSTTGLTHYAIQTTSGQILFANSSTDAVTASTRLDVRGVSGGIVLRLAESGNTAFWYASDNGSVVHAITKSATFTTSRIAGGLTASSGTSQVYTSILIDPTYNTTGTFTGTARGVYYNPTLTSTTGLTHIAFENTSGQIRLGGITQDDTKTQILVKDSSTNQVFWRDASTLGSGGDYWPLGTSANLSGDVIINDVGSTHYLFLGNIGSEIDYFGIYANYIEALSPSISFSQETGVPATSSGLLLDNGDITMTAGNDIIINASSGSMVYSDDASPRYTARSVVDKAYVDAAVAGAGGGITNGAAANELMKSDGTNAVASGLFSTTAGDLFLGSGLAGSQRYIYAEGSATDVSLNLLPKGNGNVYTYFPSGSYWQASVSNGASSSVGVPFKVANATLGGTAGIGVGIDFDVQAGSYVTGAKIEAVSTDVTAGSEDFEIVFKAMAAGASATEVARMSNSRFIIGPSGTYLGLTSTSGTNRDIIAQGSGTDVGIELNAKGAGRIQLTSPNGGTHDANVTSATNSTVINSLKLSRDTSGVPAAGIGVGLAFEVETGASNLETGAIIEAVTTSITGGSEAFKLVFKTMTGGLTPSARFQINGVGAIGLSGDNYGTAGQVLTSNGSGSAATWTTVSGGGITNSAAADELMKSDGTNAVASGLFSTSSGNITMGASGTVGTSRSIGVAGSETNVGISLTSKGTGDIVMTVSTSTATLSSGDFRIVTSGQIFGIGGNVYNSNRTSAITNSVETGFAINHLTSATPANGIGVSLDFGVESLSGSLEIGAKIEVVSTDVTNGSEDFNLVFKTMQNGAAASTKLTLYSYGAAVFSGTYTATGLNHAFNLSHVVNGGAAPTHATLNYNNSFTFGSNGQDYYAAFINPTITVGAFTGTKTIGIYYVASGTPSSDHYGLVIANGKTGLGVSSPSRQLHVSETNTDISSVTYAQRLSHIISSGTQAIGIGVGLEFEVHTSGTSASGTRSIGATIEAIATDVTAASEDFKLVFKTMAGGAAAAQRLQIDDSGLSIPSAAAYYLGDPATDGSWRFVRSGDDLLIQQREAGTYNTKSTISGA